MRVSKFAVIAAAACTVLLLACAGGDDDDNNNPSGNRVVFVGASITESWDFNHYFGGRDFRKVCYYDWKKSDDWQEVAALEPDFVVVKECAAYFYTGGGTPLNEFEAEIRHMVELIRGAGATPVLATTIPVDVGFGGCTQPQLNDIRTFNNWLRTYCSQQHIVCMDLYNAIADNSGQLPRDCHDGDGLHPNSHGYDLISPVVLPALQQAGLE